VIRKTYFPPLLLSLLLLPKTNPKIPIPNPILPKLKMLILNSKSPI
jgi:hypothetical protein